MKIELNRIDMPKHKRKTHIADINLDTFYSYIVKICRQAERVIFIDDNGETELLRSRNI